MRRKANPRPNGPDLRLYFALMFLVSFASFFYNIWLGIAETTLCFLLLAFYRTTAVRRRQRVARQVETMLAEGSVQITKYPLPMAVVSCDNLSLLWHNSRFASISGLRDHIAQPKLTTILPEFSLGWLLDGATECPRDVSIGKHIYTVYGNILRGGDRTPQAALYFIETTELSRLRREYSLSRPVASLIVLDNYEEILKNTTESTKSMLLAEIDARIGAWAAPYDGILRRFDRDRLLFIFEYRHLIKMTEGKFPVLEMVRSIVSPSGIPVTLSIGIGLEAPSLRDSITQAYAAIDMALSRGGDQAVIKNRATYEFFGGHTKELEKRTKVKSRVMSAALGEMIDSASSLLIMGHKNSDADCIAAAAGIFCAARHCGKPARIVVNREVTAALALIDVLDKLPEYQGALISPEDALSFVEKGTLLVVVDVSRPGIVEVPELLDACPTVAVIDHHRRAAQYIDHAAFSFHEPYASSASELVTELLQYIIDPKELLRAEAELLLAGIVLDTKNFTMHTGVRTFEAAAYLRGAGADTIRIKKLFQTDFASSIAKYDIIRSARMYKEGMAIARVDQQVDRTVAAAAADDILSVSGVTASFVLFPSGNQVIISARSLGHFNVQMALEKLGGGGHQTIAGAQLTGITVPDAMQRLISALDAYLEDFNCNCR